MLELSTYNTAPQLTTYNTAARPNSQTYNTAPPNSQTD